MVTEVLDQEGVLGPVEHLHAETVLVVVVVVVVAGDVVVVLVLDVPHHDQDWRGSGYLP